MGRLIPHTLPSRTEESLLQLFDILEMDHFGMGKDSLEALPPYVWKNKKLHLYVLSGYWTKESMERKFDYYATPNRPGVNRLSLETVTTQIQEIRKKDKKAYIVVFPHWGSNYEWRDKYQRETGHAIIKAGADIIVGHGAHQLQEVEFYRGHWIIYNLGNFIFGAPGRYKKMENGFPYSLALQMEFQPKTGELVDLKLFPFFCDNRKSEYQSRLCKKKEMDVVLEKLIRKMDDDNPDRKMIDKAQNDIGRYFDLSLTKK